MGKATIISEVEGGQYTVSLVYAGRARVTAWVADLTAKIAALEDAIAGMDDGMEKTIAELRVQSFVKKKQYYEEKMPSDRTVTIWCADKTESLTGSVGTIEVPGERHDGVNIQPGHDANAVYDAARDGQLLPSVATSAAAAYFNRAIMPGWQKDKPTYRYATIVADSIDFDADTCDVCLDPAYSSQQNLDINQSQGFSECASDPPAGFGQFCTDNPAHPTCTNTEAPAGLHISVAQYETIKNINAAVNAAHDYETDKSGFGVGEHWVIMGPGDKGDCEDFALTKMQALIDAGFDVNNLQLGWGQTETGGNHAFLIIQTNNRGALILDNRYPGLMQIGNVPYRFQGYQQAGTTWKSYTTLLTAVPIEYMNCNAMAFADGDEVIVEFTGQDFATPKVIGFKDNPQACISGALFFFTAFAYPYTKIFGWNYNIGGFSFVRTAELTAQPTYYAACGTPDSGTTVHFIGGDTDNFNTSAAEWNKTKSLNYQYTVSADAWAVKTDMNFKRSYFGCFSTLKGGIFAVCGWDRPATFRSSMEKYDPVLDSWAARASNIPLTIFGVVVLSGYGFTWGGSSNLGWPGVGPDNRRYDPDANAWAAKAILPRSMAVMCAFEDFATGKGYIAGGATIGQWDSGKLIDDYGVYLTERCYEYDPEANAWVRKTDYPTHGCDGRYYAGAVPPGWYINPDDCKTPAGYGPWGVPAAGGNDQGFVVEKAIYEGGGIYHVMPTSKYQPSTDTWAVGELVPEKIAPFYAADNGCGCSI